MKPKEIRWPGPPPFIYTKAQAAADVLTIKKQIVHLPGAINNFRQSQGLERIPLKDELCRSATRKTEHMVIHGYYGHEGPEGNQAWAWDLARDEGYSSPYVAENLMECYVESAAERMCKIWEDSLGHRRAMLGNWHEFGVGFAINEKGNAYVAAHFATRR
ncbi:uncharacterized protein YkwD [Arthrobacter sp. V1I9]|uniref:CAP domain-containing protein n=1 Tax=Arthrobacter sp. V1I9 TaxID=3042275 RepID=UPI0027935F1A|nr:CAP domain-containing protein [Arthrobacter sp. V1I9]MDQ0869015.1 uncharacterized protein YkwD [Arthrobacter sp. V1I9]